MKHIATILVLLFSTIAISCSSNRSKVENAAQGYLEAASRYDFDGATPFVTQNTRENAIPMMKKILSRTDTNYIKANQPAKIELKDIRIDSTTACVHFHKETPIQAFDDSVNLILEDGAWLVDIKLAPIPLTTDTTSRLLSLRRHKLHSAKEQRQKAN